MNRSSSPKKFPLLGGAQAARPLRFPWISTSTLQLTQVLQVVLPKHLVFWPRATVRRWRVWSLPVCCRQRRWRGGFRPRKHWGIRFGRRVFKTFCGSQRKNPRHIIYIYIIHIYVGETTICLLFGSVIPMTHDVYSFCTPELPAFLILWKFNAANGFPSLLHLLQVSWWNTWFCSGWYGTFYNAQSPLNRPTKI